MTTLFIAAYQTEKEHVNSLPETDTIHALVKPKIKKMIQHHSGVVVFKDDTIIGYLIYVLGDQLFGNQQCAFVPLYGHASVEENKYNIYQMMLNDVSQNWIKHKRLSWVTRLFEHDPVLAQFSFKNGYGQRCADAMKKVQPRPLNNQYFTIVKATNASLKDIKTLHQQHNDYYPNPPLCLPRSDSDPFKELKAWFNVSSHHLWIAYKANQAVGYVKLEPNGESFISQAGNIMNITGAYSDPSVRKQGIAKALLNTVETDLASQHILSYGVDYETTNPLGRQFWESQFTPYTKTVTRRIDEGILNNE